MPRIARLTDALRNRRNALVFVGAAAALAGAGVGAASASAATVATSGSPAVITDAAVAAPSLAAADMAGGVSLGSQAGSPSLGASAAATPLAAVQQAHQPAAQQAASNTAAQQAASQQPASPAAPAVAQPAPRPQYSYQIYDSTTPSAIPGNHVVATYATGNFAVQGSAVAPDKAVVWIDTNGTDPHAAALDIEPGDVTPSQAPGWVKSRLAYDPSGTAILYTFRSDWSQVQSAVSTLPQWMQSHIRWWIADPTGVPHMVPGANATQWYWGSNYDISTASPGF
jgi:hypothetical protein